MKPMKWLCGGLLLVLMAGFCGCSEEDLGKESPNLLPETVLSNAPPQGSVGSFSVQMNWYGTDPDGDILGYFFSWDDTSDWFFTPSTNSTFVVSADNCVQCDYTDTLYWDTHTFWVKAMDNRGGHDPTPEHRSFTAESTAPITTITRGPCERNYCSATGRNVLFQWSGFDPDGGEVDSFFYKLNLTRGLREIADSSWVRVGADCTYVRFADVERTMPVTGRNNSFAVVAKDNAGAIERVLVEGQNWCCFDPLPGTEMKIVINGGILGTRNNKAGGGPANVQSVSEVFRGVEVGFRWEGDATGYGANVVGFRYAVEDTTEWTAWYSGNTRYPESGEEFVPSVGNHVLYVEGLDDLGTVSLCYFKYYVEPGPRIGESYPLLIVDDSQYSGQSNSYGSWVAYLADQTEEDFFERVFEGYPYTEFDCRAQGREPPPVSLVGRYRTVFWYYDDNNGIGGELKPIFQLGTRFLDSYVGVGGNMILSGQQPALALDPDCRPNYAYPFRYDDLYCQENQTVPFSFSRMGLKGLFIDGQERFKGAISTDPDFPSLPIGAIWPFVSAQDTMWLWEVEAFNPGDVNTRVNARAIYDYDYFIAAGEDSETVMSWRHCALIVDNATNPQVGSTAYFGWPLIWCDWDSVAAFMREFLTDVCNEPPTSR